MDALKGLISNKFNSKSTLARQVRSSLVVEKASEIIKQTWGKKMQDMVMVVSLVRGTLKVHCADAITAQELKFKQNMIVKEINKQFEDELVKKLRIVQSGLEKDIF